MTLDDINDALDPLTDQAFPSPDDAWQAVALVLEAGKIEVPQVESYSNEMLFDLQLYDENDEQIEEPHYLYVVMDEEDDGFHIYATIADQEDLDAMQDVDEDDDDSTDE